jgi:hypothetical protein
MLKDETADLEGEEGIALGDAIDVFEFGPPERPLEPVKKKVIDDCS